MESFTPIAAKLLLFGEHSILLGSPAITLPLYEYTAVLRFPSGKLKDEGRQSNHHLGEFSRFLRRNEHYLGRYIDIVPFEKAIDQGLFLDSQITPGYGLGSSASVCVAVYSAFGLEKLEEPAELKKFYSQLESFFHGRSSGLDPLTIHMGRPLVVRGESIDITDHKILAPDIYAYLLDSGTDRNAADMIRIFQQELIDPEFKYRFQTEYLPLLDLITKNILRQEPVSWEMLKEVSRSQLNFFRKLIPESVHRVWKGFPEEGNRCLKVLGAGGGGYFLIFSKESDLKIPGFKIQKIRI